MKKILGNEEWRMKNANTRCSYVPRWPKPRFRLFRGQCRPEAGPAGIRKCFHSMRKMISDISISSGVTWPLMKNPLLEISKISFRSSIVQNVFLSEINSSDTGNPLKSTNCDLPQLLQTQELLPSSNNVYEDTQRSARPPLPSSKARPAIPRGTASRRHLLRQENCRRGRSKCLTTRRRIRDAPVWSW